MQKIAGIIAEYNPFHNGHKWQLEKIRSLLGDVPVVAVMSGHFTQRGEPALLDKWARAHSAVTGGVDLVLELPFFYACKSAEFFARGGVDILNATGVVTDLCFGAECEDINLLRQIAEAACQPLFSLKIKEELQKGKTYAKAMELSIKAFFPRAPKSVHEPNSTLGIEYIKALSETEALIQPLAIKRTNTRHLDRELKDTIASATAIREELKKQLSLTEQAAQAIPPDTAEILSKAFAEKTILLDWSVLEKIALYRLRQLSAEEIRKTSDVSEGLENRLKVAASRSRSLAECITAAASRRYPQTRLMRIIIQLVITSFGTTAINPTPDYLRVLAFNDRGRSLIKKILPKASYPVITNLPVFYRQNKDLAIKRSLDTDIAATDAFYLLTGKNSAGHDFYQKPIYVK